MPFLIVIHACVVKRRNIDTSVRPRLYGEKLSRVKGSPSYPSYPGRTNFSDISLQNFTNRLHEKQKVGSARRVTRLAGPTFLHIKTLARPAESTRKGRRSEHARALLSLESQLGQWGQFFFSYKRSLKLTWLGG